MARFTKQDWLDIGFALLKARGSEALTLESLTAAAGRTRGSFYHHFADRDGFIRALLQEWRERAGEGGTRRILAAESPPELRRAILDWPFALDHTLERAIRRFAAAEPIARDVLKEVDRARIDGLAALIRRLEPESADPDSLAFLQYAILVGSEWLLEAEDPRLPAIRAAAHSLFWPERQGQKRDGT